VKKVKKVKNRKRLTSTRLTTLGDIASTHAIGLSNLEPRTSNCGLRTSASTAAVRTRR